MFNATIRDFPTNNSRLTKENFISSLSNGILNLGFENEEGSDVYPCGAKRKGNNKLVVEMNDGTHFVLMAKEVKVGANE